MATSGLLTRFDNFYGTNREKVYAQMINAKDYLQIIDDAGRIIRDNERAEIGQSSQQQLSRLNIPQEN